MPFMKSLCLTALLIISPVIAQALTYHELMDQYTGRWIGSITVSTFAGEVIRTLEVEQQYWWKDEVQYAVVVYNEDGLLSFSESIIYVKDGKLYSEIYSDSAPRQEFVARLQGDSFVWMSTDMFEAMNKQIVEKIIERDGQLVLTFNGYENIYRDDQQATLVIGGELIQVEE